MIACLFNPIDCAINSVPPEWYWAAGGLVVGYLWGKLGVLGLVISAAGLAYWRGRKSTMPHEAMQPGTPRTPPRKERASFPRLKALRAHLKGKRRNAK